MKKELEFDSAATVTIKDAGRMTDKGRKTVANWLRKEALFFEKNWAKMAPRYTARFRYAK